MNALQRTEVDRFLSSGDHDNLFEVWPGGTFVDRARNGSAALKDALDRQWRDQRYVRAITDHGDELIFDDALMSSWPILSGAVSSIVVGVTTPL